MAPVIDDLCTLVTVTSPKLVLIFSVQRSRLKSKVFYLAELVAHVLSQTDIGI